MTAQAQALRGSGDWIQKACWAVISLLLISSLSWAIIKSINSASTQDTQSVEGEVWK